MQKWHLEGIVRPAGGYNGLPVWFLRKNRMIKEGGKRLKGRVRGRCRLLGIMLMFVFISACGRNAAARWQEQYDLGQQYLLEENYEQAIVAFTEAIEIEPMEIQAYTGLIQAYWKSGDPDNADSIIQSGIAILTGEGSLPSEDTQIEFLLTAKEFYEENGDREKLIQVLEFLAELDQDNEEYQRLLEETAVIQSFMENHQGLLQELAQFCQNGDDEAVWELMLSDEFRTAISSYNEDTGRVVYPLDAGNALALVEYGRVYYGGIEQGLRSGNGVLYTAHETSHTSDGEVYHGYCYLKFTGTWPQDLAEGQGTLQINNNYEGGLSQQQECSGEYIAGKENGARTFVYTNEEGLTRTFYYTAENGQAVTVDVSEYGENIAAYAEEAAECYLCFDGELSTLFDNGWTIYWD